MADRVPGRPRRAAVATTALLLLAAATAGLVLSGPPWRSPHPAAAAAVTLGTAPVVRTDLANTVQLAGSLGYAGSYTIVDQAAGTAYTQLPAPGAIVRRGQELYEVDGAPVTLFYGSRPAWRPLAAGVTPGPDVAQLDRNLITLGYGAGLAVSGSFTGATAYAVGLWQAARGLPVTGTVPLGQVAYAPGPLRVTGVTPVPGTPAQPGTTVLTATSPVPVVLAAVPVGQQYLVKPGDQVTVTLPDGVSTTPGVVSSVSPVASATAGPAAGAQPSPGPSSGSGASPDTVTMTVRLTHPDAAGHLDQAPVTVSVVSAQARGVLAVPLTALVALAGGGYAVDVVRGGTVRLVPVQTGLFAQTLVQVSGPGLAAGQQVQVPSG